MHGISFAKSGEIFIRAYELKDIEKVVELPNGVHSEIRGLTDGSASTIISVADMVAYVKKYDENLNPKPASEVVNENGTPIILLIIRKLPPPMSETAVIFSS